MAKPTSSTLSDSLHYFGYEIEEQIYRDVISTLERIKAGGRSEDLGREAANNLVVLTRIGLQAYYERPASLIELSPLVRKAADTGISTIFKAVDMVIHKVMAKRSLEELQTMAHDMCHLICVAEGADPSYYICFPLPAHLFERSQTLLARVQQDSNVDLYRHDIIQSLEELIEEAIGVFYTSPISKVQVGRITKAAADVGMTTVKKGSSMVLNKVFKTMPHAEMLPLAAYFETLLHQGILSYHGLHQSAR